MAHGAHDMVSRILAVFQGYYFNRVRGIVGTHDQVTVRSFDVPDDASAVFTYGVYVTFALAVWSQRIIVAVRSHGGGRPGWRGSGSFSLRIPPCDRQRVSTPARR